MAADTAARLTDVHATANTNTLGQLAAERRLLEQVLADAPADAANEITAATEDLEALHARRNIWAAAGRNERLIATIDRAITRTQTRLTDARDRQQARVDWFDTNAETVEQFDLIRRAERHRRAKITENPQRHLPAELVTKAGPEPASQGERRIWHATLVQRAIIRDLNATRIETDVPELDAAIDEPGIEL